MSKNDVTGDKLISKINNKNFEDGYDKISGFGKKEKKPDEEWDEKRIDIVGQNGNVGYDLDIIYQKVHKESHEDHSD